MGHRRDAVHAIGGVGHAEGIERAALDGAFDRGVETRIRAAECRRASRWSHRESIERAEAVVIQVVVVNDDQIFIAELGHEVKGRRILEGADQRRPLTAVGIDRPDGPQPPIAQSLAFIAREHDATIAQRHGMQGAIDRHGRDRRDVAAILVHDEELQRRIGEALGRRQAVAIAGESDPAAGQRTRAEIQDAVAQSIEFRRWIQRIRLIPMAGARIRRELPVRQALDHAVRQADAVDVGAVQRQVSALRIDPRQIVEEAVVDPLGIKGNERIGHRAGLAVDQHFFATVGFQQHQIRAWISPRRMEDLRPGRIRRIAMPRLANVDHVVGEGLGRGGDQAQGKVKPCG